MPLEESRTDPTRFARRLFAGLPDRYDRLGAVLSLGQDRRWRRAMVDPVVAADPRSVLDVATGPAGVALQLAARTRAHVTGLDVSRDMLRAGVANVARRGQGERISLLLGQGQRLPFADATFDAVTFTYLLRYVTDPAATIAELARVVRPGGTMASLEFAVPAGTVWHPLWLIYTRAVLPVAGGLTGGRAWWEVGRFLGPSISAHYRQHPLDAQLTAWREAGFADVQARVMSVGGGVVVWGHRAPRGL